MALGTFTTAIGVIGLMIGSHNRWVWFYALALFISQVGLNCIYSATVLGLVPDTIEAQGRGSKKASASGVIAILGFIGNLLGMSFMMLTAGVDMTSIYPLYLASISICAVVVWIF